MKQYALGVAAVALASMVAAGDAYADMFVLRTGETFEGTIIQSLGNTLSIKLDTGMRQIPLSAVDRVEIPATDGSLIRGGLSAWSDGAYLLVTDQGLIEVKDGVITRIVDELAPQATNGTTDDQVVPPKKVEPTM